MVRSFGLTALALFMATACSHKQPVKQPVGASSPAEESKAAEPQAEPARTPASPNLAVANDLSRQCALHFNNSEQAPKFDFDQFNLLPEDRNVLDQVATCVTSGPLKGRKLQLIGRADPRGTDEYNLALGDRRAHTVVDYLKHLGVDTRQVASTTRGELDARGRDEDGWRIDRRVDLQLAN